MSVTIVLNVGLLALQSAFGWSDEALGPVVLAIISGVCVLHLLLMNRHWQAEAKDAERERAADQPAATRKPSSST